MNEKIDVTIFDDADIDINPLLEIESKIYSSNDQEQIKLLEMIFSVFEEIQEALKTYQEQTEKFENKLNERGELLDDLTKSLGASIKDSLEFEKKVAMENTAIPKKYIDQYHARMIDEDSELMELDRELYEIVRQYRGF